MELTCPNKECNHSWDYTGKKSYPSWVACPDCLRRVKLPKVEECVNRNEHQLNAKCVFANIECIYPDHTDHDGCRNCRHVPDMVCRNNIETQYKYLCGVAGQRDKCEEHYGSIGNESPTWMMQILEKYHGITGVEACFDHVRCLGTLVISEPYRLHMEDFRSLIEFCDENDLSFAIDGDAAWFPGRTFRILMTKKDKRV